MKFKIFAQFLVLILFFSCTKNTELETALQFAGDNRAELEKVLSHYSKNPADSLKLRAAEFLINNMVYHYSIDSNELRKFYDFIDSQYKSEMSFFDIDSIYKKYISMNPLSNPTIYMDIEHIKSDYLLYMIDAAFMHWQTQWTKHLNFNEFCEYILPYRIEDEVLESWREIFIKKHEFVFEINDFTNLSVNQACEKLNNELKKNGVKIHYNPTYTRCMKPSSLVNIKYGTCRDYNHLGWFAMRSFGIPVAVDCIPSGHSWNVLIASDKEYDFSAGEHNLGEHLLKWKRIPKVFRQTYSINYNSLALVSKNEAIPLVFSNPNMRDVTKMYFKGADITVSLETTAPNKQKYVYLCVNYDNSFRFVDWSKKTWFGKAKFNNLGDSIVYFPMYYGVNGVPIPASYPILICNQNDTRVLKPQHNNTQSMILHRKYPIKDHHLLFLERAVNGIFQGANNSDFSDAVDLYVIRELPEMKMNIINIRPQNFRYLRYLSPKGSHCSMAEIVFLESNNKNPLKGKVLGTDGCYMHSPGSTKDKVFDGDLLTYYDAENPDGAWVGLDLGLVKEISSIHFITRNDDNGVVAGETYELLYMDLKGWISMGIVVAQSNSLSFNNVPTNALYLLRNHTKGKEERIFTYENGKQVWW